MLPRTTSSPRPFHVKEPMKAGLLRSEVRAKVDKEQIQRAD